MLRAFTGRVEANGIDMPLAHDAIVREMLAGILARFHVAREPILHQRDGNRCVRPVARVRNAHAHIDGRGVALDGRGSELDLRPRRSGVDRRADNFLYNGASSSARSQTCG